MCGRNKFSRLERKSPVLPSSRPDPAGPWAPPPELPWRWRCCCSPATSEEPRPLALRPSLRPAASGSPESTGWGGWARNCFPQSWFKTKKAKKTENKKDIIFVCFLSFVRVALSQLKTYLSVSLISCYSANLSTIMTAAAKLASQPSPSLTVPSKHGKATKCPFQGTKCQKITQGESTPKKKKKKDEPIKRWSEAPAVALTLTFAAFFFFFLLQSRVIGP